MRVWIAGIAVAAFAAAPQPELKYVVIVSRHGVRSPTWDAARLNQYSVQPWPDFGVAPGELTPHGRDLIKLLGAYYRERWSAAGLLHMTCEDARHIYIWADSDQRTLETGRAFAESLAPGCSLTMHSAPGKPDPIFDGNQTLDTKAALDAVRARLGANPSRLMAQHRAAIDTLQFILTGGKPAQRMLIEPPGEVAAEANERSIELRGPFSPGSTLSENLLFEYTNGMQGAALGWGRLTKQNLVESLELHTIYADLVRRTPYMGWVRSSNLLGHVLRSMEQAVSQNAVDGALGSPGDAILLLAGHDTNQSNISGMLNLTWSLPGYQTDDTPPGGAIIFSLWKDNGKYAVGCEFLAQSLDQMHDAAPLSLARPPESQEVAIPGCQLSGKVCSWKGFAEIVRKALQR